MPLLRRINRALRRARIVLPLPGRARVPERRKPRLMLNAAVAVYYSVIADYNEDFIKNTDSDPNNDVIKTQTNWKGWQYLWNQPVGWDWHPETYSVGDLATGPITDPASFKPLSDATSDSGEKLKTADGDANGSNNAPAQQLKLSASGGHPGDQANIATDPSRYAIAAYTVDQTGFYSIVDSRLRRPDTRVAQEVIDSGKNDGVEVLVQVGPAAGLPGQLRQVLRDVVLPGAEIDFDSQPFFVHAGQTIYVAFGVDISSHYDAFDVDFSLAKFNQGLGADQDVVFQVADYQKDFKTGTPATGWRYLWNAPPGWSPEADVTGDMAKGEIGNPANYRDLIYAGTQWWRPDGDNYNNHTPDNNLRLSKTDGHPGIGGSPNGANKLDRYAIAAYTVQHSGRYAIMNSTLKHPYAGSDGVEVLVHVNGNAPVVRASTTTNNFPIDFDTDLGYLAKGDTIYVGIGPGANDAYDTFNLDFSVMQLAPSPAPLRSITVQQDSIHVFEVTSSGATKDNPNDNDLFGIQKALDSAKAYQLEHPTESVEVHFEPGTYHIYPKGNEEDDFVPNGPGLSVLKLQGEAAKHIKNVVINGDGSTILLRNPTKGLFNIQYVDNLIIKNLTIDYTSNDPDKSPNARLPFTQGVIKDVYDTSDNSNDYLVVQIDPGFPLLKAPNFHEYKDTNYYPSKSDDTAAIIMDSSHTGRPLSGTSNLYIYLPDPPDPLNSWGPRDPFEELDDNRNYRVPMKNFGSEVQPGQHIVFNMRAQHLISINNTSRVTFSDIDIYASPNMGIVGGYNDRLSFLRTKLHIKPVSGRLLSLNTDGLHFGNTSNIWIEDSFFEGMGDDTLNTLQPTYGVKAVDPTTKKVSLQKLDPDGSGGATPNPVKIEAFQAGNLVRFFEPTTGKVVFQGRVTGVVPDETQEYIEAITLDRALPSLTAYNQDGNAPPNNTGSEDEALATQIYNVDLGANLVFRDSVVQNQRARALLVRSENSQVLNNRFEGIQHNAIRSEVGLPEGLAARNLTIFSNDFIDCGLFGSMPNIYLHIKTKTWDSENEKIVSSEAKGSTVHENISILNNHFSRWNTNAIYLRNTRRADIRDNDVVSSGPTQPSNVSVNPVRLASVQDADITDNTTAPTNPFVSYKEDCSADADCSLRINETGTVTVTNDAPTGITLSNTSVAQNSPPGTLVGYLSATDSTVGETFSYELVSGAGATDNGLFKVEYKPTVDLWQLITKGSFPNKNPRSIRLRVIDSFGNEYEKAFTITIN
jgi:hypothetical protein